MKFATWNVNSLRARADRVEDWLENSDVDVLTIQETKARDENFPWSMFEMAGYQVAHFGYSQWNGVAIVSRVGLEDVQRGFEGQPTFGKTGGPTNRGRAISAVVGTKTPMSNHFGSIVCMCPMVARLMTNTCTTKSSS